MTAIATITLNRGREFVEQTIGFGETPEAALKSLIANCRAESTHIDFALGRLLDEIVLNPLNAMSIVDSDEEWVDGADGMEVSYRQMANGTHALSASMCVPSGYQSQDWVVVSIFWRDGATRPVLVRNEVVRN